MFAGLRSCDCDYSSHNRGRKEHASSQGFRGEEGHRGWRGRSRRGAEAQRQLRRSRGGRGSQERGGPMNRLAFLLLCKC